MSSLPAAPDMLATHVIDNHTHLDSTAEYSGLGIDESLAKASAVGVLGVVDVGCDVASSRQAVANAARDPRVRAAVALHPNDAARLYARAGCAAIDEAMVELEALAQQPGVVAIGETGLDYYRTRDDQGRSGQQLSFLQHIDLAARQQLTLVIHDRDAHDDILATMDSWTDLPERVVMHCFSGDVDFARECVRRGYWLSFPGTVTFKANDGLREAAKATPLDRILVETDAPYLTPMPHRGKPNAPYLLPHTVRFLAELLAQDLDEFCRQLTANTEAAYHTSWGSHA